MRLGSRDSGILTFPLLLGMVREPERLPSSFKVTSTAPPPHNRAREEVSARTVTSTVVADPRSGKRNKVRYSKFRSPILNSLFLKSLLTNPPRIPRRSVASFDRCIRAVRYRYRQGPCTKPASLSRRRVWDQSPGHPGLAAVYGCW